MLTVLVVKLNGLGEQWKNGETAGKVWKPKTIMGKGMERWKGGKMTPN